MAFTTMVNGSGRIVIPKEIREEMAIRQRPFLLVEKGNDDAIRLKIVRAHDDARVKSQPENRGDVRENPVSSNDSHELERLRKFLRVQDESTHKQRCRDC